MPENAAQEILDSAREQALAECMDLASELIDSLLGADGFAVGDHALDRGERIARFEDFASRGVLDALAGISLPTHDMLVRQYVKDAGEALAGSPASARSGPQGPAWFGLDGTPPGEIEVERSFRVVSPSRLPPLPQPWLLVQGYRDDEHSLRLIPARRMAFARIKKPGTQSLARRKWSQPVDYSQAASVLTTLPRIATKARYLVRDEGGRAWLIDHITTAGDHWIAETELQGSLAMELQPPPWVGAEVTQEATGYTWHYAVPMNPQELTQALSGAQRGGNAGSYTPSEQTNPPFQWVLAPGSPTEVPPPEVATAQPSGLLSRIRGFLGGGPTLPPAGVR